MASTKRKTAHALHDLAVHFISLVEHPAHRRAFLAKRAVREGLAVVEKSVRIVKQDAGRKMVYGVVLVPGEVDDEGDTITREEIEKSAYAFMQAGRIGQIDSDHDAEAGKGFVAESWLVRRGDPLFGEEPEGAWAVGVKVTDKATWKRVKKGTLTGFSVSGVAKRVPVKVGEGDTTTEDEMTDVEKGAVPQDGDAAEQVADQVAERFADRVIAKLKAHFGSGEVEKARRRRSPEVQEKKNAGVTLGERIKVLRDEHGLTNADLSEAADRSERTIGRIISGEVERPADEVLEGLAGVLGVKVKALKALRGSGTVEKRRRRDETERGREGAGEGGREGPPAAVEKSFKEKLLQQQLWSITSALSDSIREALSDEEVTDKVAAVRAVADEFTEWLESHVGEAVKKGAGEPKRRGDEETGVPAAMGQARDLPVRVEKALLPLREQVEAVAETVRVLSERLETVEKQTPGRQTVLGGDGEAVEKSEKGFRGLAISL